MMRLRWILLLAGVLLLASAVAGVAQPHFGHAAGTTTTKTITVTGNGSVTTVPDRAGFDFTVEPGRPPPRPRSPRTPTAAAAVVAAVKNAGRRGRRHPDEPGLAVAADEPGRHADHRLLRLELDLGEDDDRESRLDRRCRSRRGRGRRLRAEPLDLRPGRAVPRRAEERGRAAHAKAQALADAAGLTPRRRADDRRRRSAVPRCPSRRRPTASAGVAIQPGTQTVDATVTVTYNAS